MSGEVYYRLYRTAKGEPVVACMQSFDEYDYDQSRFLGDERYPTEEAAQQALDLAIVNAMKLLGQWPPKGTR